MCVNSARLFDVKLVRAHLKKNVGPSSWTCQTQFCIQTERAIKNRNFICNFCGEWMFMDLRFRVPKVEDTRKGSLRYFYPQANTVWVLA